MRKELPNKYLLMVDICSLILSFLAAAWIRYGSITEQWFHIRIYGVAIVIVILLYIVIYYMYDTYSKLFKRGFLEEMLVVIRINCFLAVTLTAILFIFQRGAYFSRLFFLCFFLVNVLTTYIFRQYFKLILLGVYKKSNSSNKIMVMTTSDQVTNLLATLQDENEWEYQITGLIILDKTMIGQKIKGIMIKADIQNMFEVVRNEVIDGVFLHIPNGISMDLNLEETVLEFQNMGITVDLSINTFGLRIHEKVVREVSGYHVLTFSSRLFTESQLILKRLIDLAGGLIGSMVTLLLTVFIAPAILIESRGPIFFTQVRIGRNGRRFRILKFRSMYADAEERIEELMHQNQMKGCMFKMENDPRVTRVGRFLRKTSLDELPQFFNVLKGDMSLVGTRPPTEKEFYQYENRHKRRLALKSGLTGLWQVSGRSDINDFEDVVRLDLEYIDNWTLKMDIKILIKTIAVVLFGKGAK